MNSLGSPTATVTVRLWLSPTSSANGVKRKRSRFFRAAITLRRPDVHVVRDRLLKDVGSADEFANPTSMGPSRDLSHRFDQGGYAGVRKVGRASVRALRMVPTLGQYEVEHAGGCRNWIEEHYADT